MAHDGILSGLQALSGIYMFTFTRAHTLPQCILHRPIGLPHRVALTVNITYDGQTLIQISVGRPIYSFVGYIWTLYSPLLKGNFQLQLQTC